MKGRVAVLAVFFLSACAAAPENSAPLNLADVVYSMSRGQNDMLELSVYNPNEFSICVSYSDWPGADEGSGNVLRVTGTDGVEWAYIGLEADTVGRAQDMHISSHAEATVHVNLRKNYRATNSNDHIGKVYYGARFVRC